MRADILTSTQYTQAAVFERPSKRDIPIMQRLPHDAMFFWSPGTSHCVLQDARMSPQLGPNSVHSQLRRLGAVCIREGGRCPGHTAASGNR